MSETRQPIGDVVEGGPARPPVREPLHGRFVRLEPLDPALHALDLFERSHADPEDDSIWTYLSYGPFDGLDEMREWLAASAVSRDPLFFTVVTTGSGEAVGVVSLMNVDTVMRRLELGHIWYVRSAQRGRANTEAVYLLLCRVFDEWGYRRAEWKCDALNARSRTAAERLGFTFEGVFRSHMIVKGRNRDTAWYSMVAEEWPARRAAMRRWLDSEPGSVSLRDLIAGADGR
jgi:RimJ/RimL family protein N-acetyltransferase